MNGLICDRCYQTCWAKIRSSQNEEMICPTCKSEEELSKVPVRGEEENNG